MDRNYINIITDLSRLFGIWRLALLAFIFCVKISARQLEVWIIIRNFACINMKAA